MKNSKSGKIATGFVKNTILITAPMLATIFNKSIQCGIFLNNLEEGKYVQFIKVKAQNQTQTITDLYLYSQLLQDYLKS